MCLTSFRTRRIIVIEWLSFVFYSPVLQHSVGQFDAYDLCQFIVFAVGPFLNSQAAASEPCILGQARGGSRHGQDGAMEEDKQVEWPCYQAGKNGEWWLVVSMVRASRQDAHFFWLVLFYYLYKVNRMPTHIFLKFPSLCISGECSCRFE